MSRLVLAALIAASAALAAVPAGTRYAGGVWRWACYYGKTLTPAQYASVDLAVLEPDAFEPPAKDGGPTRIGYVSVGQVEVHRPYWARIKDKPFVLEKDPDWPDARRIDVRSKEWQDLLLDEVMPKILAKGYRGFFFDTIDTAEYLENKDPKKYAGSVAALQEFVRRARKRFPDAILLTNNGLTMLGPIGLDIDGAVVEDLYTRWDFSRKAYAWTRADETADLEKDLQAFIRKTGRPVFVIVYAKSPDDAMAKEGARRARAAGFRPYVATIELDKFGGVGAEPPAPRRRRK